MIPKHVRLTIDCSLYRTDIPVELRHIVLLYSLVFIDNETIRSATVHWCDDIPIKQYQALLRYGPISYWDTSKVTDMAYLFSEHQSLMTISTTGM